MGEPATLCPSLRSLHGFDRLAAWDAWNDEWQKAEQKRITAEHTKLIAEWLATRQERWREEQLRRCEARRLREKVLLERSGSLYPSSLGAVFDSPTPLDATQFWEMDLIPYGVGDAR